MFGIEKKVTVFEKKDREAWKKAKKALKEAQLRGVRAYSYEEEPPVCGCGAKLDPRDFGAKGKIDRSTYYIEVPLSLKETAERIIAEKQ